MFCAGKWWKKSIVVQAAFLLLLFYLDIIITLNLLKSIKLMEITEKMWGDVDGLWMLNFVD